MKKTIKLIDLDCGHCAAKIETAVKKFDAILTEAKALIKKIEPDVTVKV